MEINGARVPAQQPLVRFAVVYFDQRGLVLACHTMLQDHAPTPRELQISAPASAVYCDIIDHRDISPIVKPDGVAAR